MKNLVLLTFVAALTLSAPYASSQETTATVDLVEPTLPEGINDGFKDPELKVDEWLQRFEVESREVYGAREAVLKACQITPGERIADIGAGTGFYSRLFTKRTGLDGWVFSVDISTQFLQHIAARASADNIPNLTPVLGTDTSIRLPTDSVDLVFICDTYHHFEQPLHTLASIYRALKPGGRLVLIDFARIPGKSREWTMGHVRAGQEVFQAEVEQAGFVFDDEVDIDGFDENYLLRFHKPKNESNK
ncbi:Demethylrebeccamycin-D-glucose O-methyltransferase [Roseimaritima multifibrata]|uniref:Demethylrebeccamycin-D-glucose O-methyltransferase n=1 Tax=Roseimaritima multifibrata TaxID=1930274 RepID=A0A517MLH9_9BACT|nr:methyltransferase domain-containing protein [Roseimaritima multifibrata]QDS95729.1 Demethylrebeccamycin-D-glucose O-methyltransferase [Roseimaritima multifibrata]